MTQPPAGPGPGSGFGLPEPAVIEAAGPLVDRPLPGPARVLALVATALGLLIYLLGFVGEVSVTSSFGGPLLLAGGLLAGTAVLPRVGRVLAPAAVVIVAGALLLLQLLIGIHWPTVVIVAMVLAGLQTAAVVGALLIDTGLVGAAGRSGHRGLAGPAGIGSPGAHAGEYGPTGQAWPEVHGPYVPPAAAIEPGPSAGSGPRAGVDRDPGLAPPHRHDPLGPPRHRAPEAGPAS